ncbi:uncharacterized protein LOC134814074 [Bolinopsis microptera]|uniref:uncharacterized protein LOC134814074 n=1 Tax=Bolinopsis microptera TaxID=2820187 RepID=UPI003078FC84
MVLPLSLIQTAIDHPMLIELKNGETYNGNLVKCDTWMNIYLRDVICTSKDGDQFWKIPECFIRGNTIKYMRIPDEVIDLVKDEPIRRHQNYRSARGRGGARVGNRPQHVPNKKNKTGGGQPGGGGRGGLGGPKNKKPDQ